MARPLAAIMDPPSGLNGAEKNQLAWRLRQAANGGTDDKYQKAETVEPAPAKKIAEPTHRDNQPDQNQVVDQDRPLNCRERGMKGRSQSGQRHRDSALVEADDGLADANAQQNQPGGSSRYLLFT